MPYFGDEGWGWVQLTGLYNAVCFDPPQPTAKTLTMPATKILNLKPPLVPSGKIDQFVGSGRTLASTFSPFDNSLTVFVADAVGIPWPFPSLAK
jgi:hypothetical protein